MGEEPIPRAEEGEGLLLQEREVGSLQQAAEKEEFLPQQAAEAGEASLP